MNQPPPNQQENKPKLKFSQSITFWVVLLLLGALLFQAYANNNRRAKEISYTEMMQMMDADQLEKVIFIEKDVSIIDKNKIRYHSYLPFPNAELAEMMRKKDVTVVSSKPSWLNGMLIYLLPTMLLIGFWFFWMRSMQGGSNKAFSFGKSRARLFLGGKTNTTFKDVAGVEEAKEELEEIVEYLKAPEKFQRLGGRIPRGVLLLGRPGTGKTLLAKAVAGEAGVPFYSISGSDFVEMFVGVGASRVRDLFAQAKRTSPCIAFIDEIDAVGRHRGAGLGGGHDEREQTLNQLLVEMDGFEKNDAVIIIAATNRPDVLDPALLRPGRFDRQVVVDLPDIKGREQILNVHVRDLPIVKDISLSVIARSTPGFSGADLANLCNEAALLAARKDKKEISLEDFEEAKDKVSMGKARKSRVMTDEDKKITAVHEIGHVLCGIFVAKSNPIHKVTIIPRGFSLGTTHFLQTDEMHQFKSKLEDMIVTTLGGRAAEEIIFGDITGGAAGDIEYVTGLAKDMVCRLGMSEKLGPQQISRKNSNVFLGKDIGQSESHSDKVYSLIDDEVKRIIDTAHLAALEILKKYKNILILLSDQLLIKETMDVDEIYKCIIDNVPTEQQAVINAKYKEACELKISSIEPPVEPVAEKTESEEEIQDKETPKNPDTPLTEPKNDEKNA